jgi:uncharacterized RDD family membrane protein YckC
VDCLPGRLASPGKRLAAFVLDLLFPTAAVFLMIHEEGASVASRAGAGGRPGVLTYLGVALLAAYAIRALTLFAHGTTPGKHMLGIWVIRDDGTYAGLGTMLIREWIGKWISGLILGLGYIWILLDRDRQGWHDKLVSTYVVE